MATKNVSVTEAGHDFARLIRWVEQGDEVLIVQDGQTKAKLVPPVQSALRREFGQYCGKIRIGDDFDAPLPDDFWLGVNP